MTIENQGAVTDLTAEKHYTPQQVARTLNVHPRTVVRLFRGQPGVIEFGPDERLHKRKRKVMRISKSAVEAFLAQQRTVK